jgi:hypothetical protein
VNIYFRELINTDVEGVRARERDIYVTVAEIPHLPNSATNVARPTPQFQYHARYEQREIYHSTQY